MTTLKAFQDSAMHSKLPSEASLAAAPSAVEVTEASPLTRSNV